MNIVLASLHLSENIDLKKSGKPVTGSVSAFVLPREREHIELDTGGIWSNPNWRKLEADQHRLQASISIHEKPEDPEHQDSLMVFHEGSQTAIHFVIRLDKPAMDSLVRNIRAGLIPLHLSLMLSRDPFSKEQPFDDDIWIVSKKENQQIKIEYVGFSYELIKAQRDENTGEYIEPEGGSLLEYARAEIGALKKVVSDFQRDMRNVRNIAFVLLGIYLAIEAGKWLLGIK